MVEGPAWQPVFQPLCLHLWGDLTPRYVAGTSPDLKIPSLDAVRRPGSRPGSDLMLTFDTWASLWLPDPTLACVSGRITGFLACCLGLSSCLGRQPRVNIPLRLESSLLLYNNHSFLHPMFYSIDYVLGSVLGAEEARINKPREKSLLS